MKNKNKIRSGFTLLEMTVTMLISTVVVLAVGTLLVAGQRSWLRTYDSAYEPIKDDSRAITAAFTSAARKSNRLACVVYDVRGRYFSPVSPKTKNPQEIISGDAIELRFWDVALDKTDSHNLMDTTKVATAYKLFYVDNGVLKVDYGPYPPGAVAKNGGSRKTSGVRTTVLARNVSARDGLDIFSQTAVNGSGAGSVRVNLVLTDPNDRENTVDVTAAAMMRNIWPR